MARIYKEGTEKKLHKYDGAFYSRMSMLVTSEVAERGFHAGNIPQETGTLNIIADHEGLDSELHLGIYGGIINIEAQNDGINTNEDGISVTTIGGNTVLTVNAGLGGEGDGIDSNGYLVINGGTVWTMSCDRSADGGVDADLGIFVNGGTLSAFGVQNDTATSDPDAYQPYMELSFAATLPVGSVVKLTDEAGSVLWSATTQKACQTITLTAPGLKLDTTYHLYVDDVLQCWSGNRFGMGHGGGMGGGFDGQTPPERPEGQQPDGQTPPEMPEGQQPDGQTPPELPNGQSPDGQRPDEGFDPSQLGGQRPQRPDRQDREDFDPSRFEGNREGFSGGRPFGHDNAQFDGESSTDFVLTEAVKSFSSVRAANTAPAAGISYPDVGEDDPGYAAIQAATRAGLFQGDQNGNFNPDDILNMDQMCVVLARAAKADLTAADPSIISGESADWAAPSVAWLIQNGICKYDGYVGSAYLGFAIYGVEGMTNELTSLGQYLGMDADPATLMADFDQGYNFTRRDVAVLLAQFLDLV